MTRLLFWRTTTGGPYPIPEPPVDPTTPTPPTVNLPDYRVAVEESDGTLVTFIPQAACRRYRLEADGIGPAEYEVPYGAQGLLQLVAQVERDRSEGLAPNLYGGRLALYRDGVPTHRGPITSWLPDPVRSIHTIQTGEFQEDLTGVVVGDAERINWFTGGDFEDGLPSGTDFGTAIPSIVTSYVARGTYAMQLAGGASGGYRRFVVTLPASTTFRNIWHVSAYIRVPDGEQWPFGVSGKANHDGVGQAEQFGTVATDDEDATGRFVRVEVPPIVCPLGLTTFSITVTCYAAPFTTPVFDEIRVSRNDSETVAPGGDVVQMPSTLCQAAITKADLGWTRRAYLTGEVLPEGFGYAHAEHANTWDAMTDEQWLADCAIQARHDLNQLRIGPASRLGRDRRDLQIGPRSDGGSYGGSVRPSSWDGSQVVTSAIALGDASDAVTREEEGYTLPGTSVLREHVEQAPEGTPINRLAHYAESLVRDLGDPRGVVTIALDTPRGGRSPADWLRKNLRVLDRIRVRTVADPIDVSGWHEITAIEVRPSDGDHMDIEVVPL